MKLFALGAVGLGVSLATAATAAEAQTSGAIEFAMENPASDETLATWSALQRNAPD